MRLPKFDTKTDQRGERDLVQTAGPAAPGEDGVELVGREEDRADG